MERVRLGDICTVVSGSTPKTGIPEYWDGDVDWITPAELTDESYIITESARKITEEAVKKTGLKSFPAGTVMLSSRARFVEMFGDPKSNEKEWDTAIISDYFEIKGGKRIPKGLGYSNDVTKHPYLRASDMKNETIIDDDIHYITDDVYEKIKRYTVAAGDIYLTNVGVNLGMAGVIPRKYDGANLTENAVKLMPKKRGFDGKFLAYYINSPGIQDYINERKMAVGVPKLAIFRIGTMPLIVPPLNLQKEFVAFVAQIDKSRDTIQKALDEAQLLFDSLMQEYFG